VAAAVPAAFLAVPSLSVLPARLTAGCAAWIGIAILLELGSVFGFVIAYALVFGEGLSARGAFVAGLRALGMSTVLPGGSLVGPAVAAHSAANGAQSPRRLAAPSIAFLLLTTAPGVAVLALVGISLWLGWPPGPHCAALTLPAAAVALALLGGIWRLGRPLAPDDDRSRVRVGAHWWRWLTGALNLLRDGAARARWLVRTKDRKLVGVLAYYVFDNAVLWATFRVVGSRPPVGVLVMGYLIGSLGSALPIPAGLGAVEGGLIGALVLYGAPLAPAAAAVLLYRGISLGLSVALGGFGWACHLPPGGGDPDNAVRSHVITRPPSIMWPRRRSTLPRRPSPAAGPSSK
jgi:uncharacterized membrane protein YbhN (UPF0104 family)